MGTQLPKTGTAPIFSPVYCGWMDQDATWYGGRPRRRPHCVICVRWGPIPPRKRHRSPAPFLSMSIAARRSMTYHTVNVCSMIDHHWTVITRLDLSMLLLALLTERFVFCVSVSIADHFSGPGRAIGACVCVCLSVCVSGQYLLKYMIFELHFWHAASA